MRKKAASNQAHVYGNILKSVIEIAVATAGFPVWVVKM